MGAHGIEASGARLTSLPIDEALVIGVGRLTSALSLAQQEKTKTVLLSHHQFDHTRDLITPGANVDSWRG